MNINFELILVSALAVTALIWLLDVFLWKPRRIPAEKGEQAREPLLVEYARSFFPVILIVLLLRSFLVEPFRIPSGSMMPTLLIGDFILVNKFSYGLRLPVLKTRIIETGKPSRGDVVVFRYPKDPSIDYIKRVIGVPGDVIGYQDKIVYVNGEPMIQEGLGGYIGAGAGGGMTGAHVMLEHLDGVDHQILLDPARPSQSIEARIPDGQYLVMGDNRDNSNDSRFWGTVPEENLVGKAFMIWMNLGAFERVGDKIQ
ncbi:MAG: signal peptidase I [Gammaproteobacteria bacterium RBG_16_57_12]|nr:MAG: signal peptidase I [Gammaproteobacteria bacterium RBG_16_57_12]